MKTKLLLILSAFTTIGVVAQTDVEVRKEMKIVVSNGAVKDTTIKGNEDDTLHIRLGDMKIDIYQDSTARISKTNEKPSLNSIKEFPWYGFDGLRFGFMTFVDANQKSYDAEWIQNQGRRNSSSCLGVLLLNHSYEIASERFRLNTGLGASFESIALNRSIRLLDADTLGVQSGVFVQTDKSNLNANYITVPFVFQYNGKISEQDRKDLGTENEKNVFHVSFGVIGGYLVGSNSFYKWKENGDKRKQRVAGDFGLNDYMLNLYVEAGFTSSLSFFLESGLLPKFSSGKGPEIYSNAFGLKLNF